MRSIAIVGSGMSGLGAAYELAKTGLRVCLYEKDDKLGGRVNTNATGDGVQLDLGFMLFNRVTTPHMVEFCERLGVETEDSDMSYSLSLEKGFGYEWGTRNGLSSVFAHKTNVLNPYFWKIIRELAKFKGDVHSYLDGAEKNPDMENNYTLESFIKSRGYSDLFQTCYLIPICASIWAVGPQQVMDFPALSVLEWFRNNQMLQLSGGPQWLAVKGRSRSYLDQVVKELKHRGCQIRTESEVYSVSTTDEGCTICMADGSKDLYDGCILAVHASDALKLLGNEATHDEARVLGAFQYANRPI
ncbi:hypothetical protein V2J09_005628 [Rumex salicifolius]